VWSYEKLNAVHLELSSRCNAACPGCPRHLRNSPNVDPNLQQRDISIGEFKSWFSPDALAKIENWIICGTHGDPITCKDLVEIVEYICQHSPGSIQINTNGGLRGTQFFSDLGRVLAENKLPDVNRAVIFSIDGLEDTNHLYRRQVKWDKVISNIKAYVAAGGLAAWDFLRFSYNSHQVEEAEKLAKSLGVHFRLKNPFGVDGTGMPVYDKDYNLEYVINHWSEGDKEPYVPPHLGYVAPRPRLKTRQGCIECNAFRNHHPPNHEKPMCEIYIDHLGNVQPCCFVGNKMYGPAYMEEATEVRGVQKAIGNRNNLYTYSLQEVLDNGALNMYSDSWKYKTINQCWVQCGKQEGGDRLIDSLFVK